MLAIGKFLDGYSASSTWKHLEGIFLNAGPYTERKDPIGGCYMVEEHPTADMTYIVSLSGGTGSAMAAERALQRYG